MPFDPARRRKLYPDSTINFKWAHEPEGSVVAGTKISLGEVICGSITNTNTISDHGQLKAQGFTCDPNDWRNVEQKIYFDGETGDKFITLSMGGKDNNTPAAATICPCCAFGYEASFSSNGLVKLRKKSWFMNYSNIKQVNNGPLPEGYKGVAFVRYNQNFNNAVRLECWVDKGIDGDWKRVLMAVDNGINYGMGGRKCGSVSDKEALTWGFPAIVFSCPVDYNFTSMTAREINAGGSFNEAASGGRGAPAKSGGGGSPLPSDAG